MKEQDKLKRDAIVAIAIGMIISEEVKKTARSVLDESLENGKLKKEIASLRKKLIAAKELRK